MAPFVTANGNKCPMCGNQLGVKIAKGGEFPGSSFIRVGLSAHFSARLAPNSLYSVHESIPSAGHFFSSIRRASEATSTTHSSHIYARAATTSFPCFLFNICYNLNSKKTVLCDPTVWLDSDRRRLPTRHVSSPLQPGRSLPIASP
jgi:hypothetical protein